MRDVFEPLENRTLLAATPIELDGRDSIRRNAPIGRVGDQVVIADELSAGETGDYYSFSVRGKGNVNVILDGLTSNANLRLFDTNGETMVFSQNIRARSEWISRTLKAGTYFVGVERGKRGLDTPFNLKIQADLNYETVDIDGDDVTLSLTNASGLATPIDPNRETWVTIHGWLGSPIAMADIAHSIDAASRHVQVLQLDWSSVASDVNPFNVVFAIADVGEWAANKLESWGIPGSNINLVGHSYGGYMTDEIARNVTGGVDRIVALDPATIATGGFDFSGTDYADHSQFSVAFIGSEQGTVAAAKTADETVLMDVGTFSGFQAHGNVRDLFAVMTAKNNTSDPGPIAPIFALGKLHAADRPAFKGGAISGGYDAKLVGDGNGFNIKPVSLSWVDENTDNPVTID
ncbi:MAG: pre-peptidase C-terminal domain-containing protein [Phycisphaerae bacterium]